MILIKKPGLVSIGIDPSPKATGIVVLRENGTPNADVLYVKELHYPEAEKGFVRYRQIVLAIIEVIIKFKPDRIVVEGYSLNTKNVTSLVPLVELGGLLRFMLFTDGYKWLDPRATEVKKFATGKGNSAKNLILLHVFKRWGFEAKSDNIADAYALAAIGLAHANRLPGITIDMRKIAGAQAYRTA